MKLSPDEQAQILGELRCLFQEEEALPDFVSQTETQLEFAGGLKLTLTLIRPSCAQKKETT